MARRKENNENLVQEKNRVYRIFSDYLPDDAVHYCFDLWVENSFDFVLSKKRQTKAGDYRFDPRSGNHRITVNSDLNRFSFLITLVHEIAHQHATINSGIQRPPHGLNWKNTFKGLMLPLLNNIVFPDDILAHLAKHMKNPKASTHSDPRLLSSLRNHDFNNGLHALNQLDEGAKFELNKRIFKKGKLRRTRILCEDASSGRMYLIPEIALVSLVEES